MCVSRENMVEVGLKLWKRQKKCSTVSPPEDPIPGRTRDILQGPSKRSFCPVSSGHALVILPKRKMKWNNFHAIIRHFTVGSSIIFIAYFWTIYKIRLRHIAFVYFVLGFSKGGLYWETTFWRWKWKVFPQWFGWWAVQVLSPVTVKQRWHILLYSCSLSPLFQFLGLLVKHIFARMFFLQECFLCKNGAMTTLCHGDLHLMVPMIPLYHINYKLTFFGPSTHRFMTSHLGHDDPFTWTGCVPPWKTIYSKGINICQTKEVCVCEHSSTVKVNEIDIK